MNREIDADALASALLRQGLAERIALAQSQPAPLMTRAQLATALAVQPAQVDRFAARGMPREYVGSDPRFDFKACRAWLAQQRPAHLTLVSAEQPIPGVHRATRRKSA